MFSNNNRSLRIGLITVVALLLVSGTMAVWWIFFKDEFLIKRYIRDWANDPDSVVLRNLKQNKRDKEVWCGEINARNRMGAMVGFQRFIFSQPDFDKLGGITDLDRAMATMTLEDADTFASKHRLLCE